MSEQSGGPGWWQASDGKWYPPAAAPPPPAAKGRGCAKWGLIAVAVVIALAVGCTALLGNAADEVSKDIDEKAKAAEDDVEVLGCQKDDTTGWMEAQLRVTNNSSERSNYIVEVRFESLDESEQFDTATALINGLDSGQTKNEKASSLTDAPDGGYKCSVFEVTRFTDEG